MSETTRPEWVSGPEWEEWGGKCEARRLLDADTLILIDREGGLELFDVGAQFGVGCKCKTPLHALTAANALADAAGGWA